MRASPGHRCSGPCDPVPSLCMASAVLIRIPFGRDPSLQPLRRALSVPGADTLFAAFCGTTIPSDCPPACMIGVRHSLPDPDCRRISDSRCWALPVPVHGMSHMQRVSDSAGSPERLAMASPDVLPSLTETRSAPRSNVAISELNTSPVVPLPTLRRVPHGPPTHDAGPGGWLGLPCRGLPPPVPCRS
jgi:hypothetical protein